ncbi:MAG: PEGA domain-containing protein [Sedimentisphaerales bacterium]|jgi:hypothetical protein
MRINKLLLLFCVLVVGAAGCVERKLTINTNPAGAQVFLNDEEIGVSPVTASFNWYGDYNITIRKQGCETLQTHRKLQVPWYDLSPFDFAVQVIYPGRIVDSYEWSFDLQPQKEVNRQELIKDAERLSKQSD